MTLADVAALQGARDANDPSAADALRVADVPVSRWWDAISKDRGYVAEVSAWAVARRAVFTRDAALVEALADHENPDAFRAAVFAADLLDLRDLAPKLAARLSQLEAGPLSECLRPLERLGVEDVRDRLRDAHAEALEIAEFAELPDTGLLAAMQGADPSVLAYIALDKAKPGRLMDRTGGDLPLLRAISWLAGPERLSPALIDALRRRDGNATANFLDAWIQLRPDDAPFELRREARARHALVRSMALHFSLVEPKKEKFDAAAELAVRHGLALAGAVPHDATGAFLRSWLAGSPLYRARATDDGTLAPKLASLLDHAVEGLGTRALSLEDEPSFALTVVQAATTFGWRGFASRVVSLVGPRSPEAAMEHAQLLYRIEPEVMAVLPETLEPGHAGLVLNGVTAAAEKRARDIVSSDRVTLRSVQGVLLATFPSDRVLQASAKVPGIVRQEVESRFEALSALDARWNKPEADAPFVHCLHCGQLSPVSADACTQLGPVWWAEPPLACPSCGHVGESTVWPDAGATPGRQWLDAPYETNETPKRALERTTADGTAANLVRADILDFLGKTAEADTALAAAAHEERTGDPAVYARLLLRRGRTQECLDHARTALNDEDADYLDARTRADLLRALQQSATALGVPVPEVRTIGESKPARPAPKLEIPRNAPCPCGSGKKYKRCHGA